MLSGFRNAFMVLRRPNSVFHSVKEGAPVSWVPALVLVTLVMLIKPVLTAPAMQAQNVKMMRAQIKQMEAEQAAGKSKLPPEAIKQMKRDMKQGMNQGASIAMLAVGAVGQAVAMWPGALLSALVVFGLAKLLKANMDFKTALVLIGLSLMPYFVGEVVKTLAAVISGTAPMGEGMSSLIISPGSGPSVVMTGGIGFTLAMLTLSRIDFFVMWSLALLGIGVHNVAGLSGRKSAALAVSYWLAALLLVGAPVLAGNALSSGMGGTTVTTSSETTPEN